MASLNVNVMLKSRSAEATLNAYLCRHLNTTKDTVKCEVYGFYQYKDADEAYPVAICELADGRVFMVDPDKIRFVDKETE